MDEPVALILAVPAIALALWAVAFVGAQANSEARSIVAAEAAAAAAAAAQTAGADPGDAARRVALGAALTACTLTDTTLEHSSRTDATAAVTVACQVPGPLTHNRVCVTGYAQPWPHHSGHLRAACAP